jgi:hypothetical protein
MSLLNLLVHLNAYKDKVPTNNPKKSHWKWTLDQQSSDIGEPESRCVDIQPGATLELFSGISIIFDDATTTYDISLKAGTTNTYRISHNAGTAPDFRDSRNTDADATTEITVTKNGPLIKFESTGGTALDLVSGGVQVGDTVRVGSSFNTANQGKFKILSFNATSFEIEHSSGQAEGPIVLGASFAEDIQIFSQAGVQVGEKLDISQDFSSVTFGNYSITDVNPQYIEIYSIKSLPEETNIQTQLSIYNDTKNFIYIETDRKLKLEVDGSDAGNIEPMSCGTSLKKGVYLKSGNSYSTQITNESDYVASVFYALGE